MHRQRNRSEIIRWAARGLLSLAFVLAAFRTGNAADLAEARSVTEYESASRLLISFVHEPAAAAVSHDGKWLATGHPDGAVILWNVEDGRPLRRLAGHVGNVDVLAFHPNAPQLASSGADGSIKLWNFETGELQRALVGHARRVATLGFSSDGRRLVSGGYDKTARLWDLADAAQSPIVLEHPATVTSAAVSIDGERIATGTLGGELRLWTKTGEPVRSPIKAHRGAIGGLVFHPKTGVLISGGDDGNVSAWNVETGEKQQPLSEGGAQLATTSPVTRLTIRADGGLLAIGDQNGAVRVWDLNAKIESALLEGHRDEVRGIALLETSNSILTAGLDHTVRLWRPKLPITPRLAAIADAESRLWATAIAPDDRTLYAAGRKGFLASWNLATGERIRRFEGFDGTIDAIALSPDGSRIACCGWKSKTALVFDVQTGAKLRELTADSNIRCVRFLSSQGALAVGEQSGVLKIWPAEGNEPRVIPTGSQPIYDIAVSPDGTLAGACTGDWRQTAPGSVTLWNTEAWAELRKFTEHTRAVRGVAFSRDGKRLASAGEDGLVILWNCESQIPVARFQNASGARPIAIAPDGSRLAAGLHDGTINIWDISKGEVVQRFRTEDDVFALAYSSDGTALVSVSGELRIEIWPGTELDSTAERIREWMR